MLVKTVRDHCQGALQKNIPLPHTLLGGPSGMGKTHLARATAKEMGVSCLEIYASKDVRKAKVVEVLTSVKKADILFVDEVHALPVDCQELLYPALDKQKAPKLDPETKKVVEGEWVSIAEFTLIAASDQHGRVRNALMQRLVLRFTLAEYDLQEMKQIVLNYAAELKVLLTPQSAGVIAKACRSIPRRARHLLKSLYTCMKSPVTVVTATMARQHLRSLGIDADGLTPEDRTCLRVLAERGGPVSLKNLAKLCGLDVVAFERDVQPWLLQRGLIGLNSSGRFLTPTGQKLVAARGLR
jgi:Holliday junction DNA helicase RuvB